jgi:hypothetical protein
MSYAAANAAREAQRVNPRSSINGPLMMSPAAQQAQQRRLNLLPTAYLYDVPQVKSSKCNLCLIAGNDETANTFVGHDAPVHRHLMCRDHYQLNKGVSDRCPECRVNMGEWHPPTKIVRIAADGTETVVQQPGAAAAAAVARDDSGGKKRKHTRGRRLRRRHSSKKSKKSKKSK